MIDEEFRVVAMNQRSAHEAIKRGYEHAKAILDNGENVMITVGPALDPIGIRQRRFLYVVLTQIAEQVKLPDGSRYTTDVWKEYFKKLFIKPTYRSYRLPGAKRSTPHRQPLSTERLGTKAFSKFIDSTIDHAVLEWNVSFVFEANERDEVRYISKTKKPAAVVEE